MEIYVVKQGDNVESISSLYNISADTLISDNQLFYPYRLAVGQALLINNGESSINRRSAYITGFAYPFISDWVLTNTLPYLSYLAVFSYGFTEDGYIIPPETDDGTMIRLATDFGVTPILTLTPFGPDGNFNNNLISSVINNETYTDRLISELVNYMSQRGFGGVDIDFEFILAEDRDSFTAFVKRVHDTLSPLGYTVSVDLAPKTSAGQRGLLYEGKDYRGLGEAADSVLLMTYEWGYKYGIPLPIAPINNVRSVVEYALTEIPAEKINLGIPNYGYDWPLPYVKGSTVATTIGNIEAVQIAINNNAEIQYDTEAQAPFFNYTENGTEHIVWFEDIRSMQAKFDLIKEYNLRGGGYWTVMQWFRANWMLLADNFEINS